ncbi:MAG: hypothetical protein VW879_15740, partial [Opitutae bacterium]
CVGLVVGGVCGGLLGLWGLGVVVFMACYYRDNNLVLGHILDGCGIQRGANKDIRVEFYLI